MSKQLRVSVPVTASVSDLVEAVKAQESESKVTFKTLDGSRVPLSEELHHLRGAVTSMRLGDRIQYMVSIGSNRGVTPDCQSLGIPKDQATLLSSFVNKSSEAISDQNLSKDDLRHSLYNALKFFKQYGKNEFGTNKVSELEKILREKEIEFTDLSVTKQAIDR